MGSFGSPGIERARQAAEQANANGYRTDAPKANRGRKAKQRRRAMVSAAPKLALAITVGMGIAIPALTLGLSTVAGRLAILSSFPLAAASFAIGATVLAVSLSHLAWAIADITRSPRWASWALAVAVDLSVVLAESVHVFAPGVVDALGTAVLAGVTLASMVLNVWAFLRHH